MNKIKWIIFATFTIGILTVLVLVSNGSKIDVSKVDVATIQIASSENGNIADHTKGDLNSKVVLIEYGDYQCPGCASYDPLIQAVIDGYKDKIVYVFRTYLLSYHTNARAAASTAEAAGLQGKYWEMHTLLYSNQSDWESLGIDERTTYFANLASQIGLNQDQYKKDIASVSVKEKINFDIALAVKAGLTATPSLYLNGKSVDLTNLKTKDSFRAVLDAAIAEKNK